MTAAARNQLLESISKEYKDASLSRKSELLDGFVTGTGYHRKYATNLLNKGLPTSSGTRKRPTIYDASVFSALVFVWRSANYICAKRLMPFLPKFLESLERFGHIEIDEATRHKLLSMSISTAERLLKRARTESAKSPALTRAGNLLRKHVQIRTFADWDDIVPGFFEADTVGHHGGQLRGQFIHSLTMTDVYTGWTVVVPLMNKTEESAITGIEKISKCLPFPVLGIDTDNGTEFMNHRLIQWCEERSITFTSSRAYKKNDQCFVEEKNGSVVRRLLGHSRFEGTEDWLLIDRLCELARVYINFFQPSVKLLLKTRIGAKYSKKYDTAKTPYQRLLEHGVTEACEAQLTSEFECADPVTILNEINSIQTKLLVSETLETTLILPASRSNLVFDLALETPKKNPQKKSVAKTSRVNPVLDAVLRAFSQLENGESLTAANLRHCGNALSVKSALERLCYQNVIELFNRGRYRLVLNRTPGPELPSAGTHGRIRDHFLARVCEIVRLQDLLHLGPNSNVRIALHRLVKGRFIQQCGRGTYKRTLNAESFQNLQPLKGRHKNKAQNKLPRK